ncbi:DUF1028 domain-containing protein [Pseudooceanicola aestuarii]|uniref:DUF1028 domain-containing protein n=1 Tax=Pseudooceanicola aestuarii TaxID=2697319 RepID=UPI0013D6BC69|nr:DUF1028 domain-containing protein [Pseudooceanicola aestuarii]
MTLTLLARERETGKIGGAVVSRALFAGGWCLRGGADCGLSASQGAIPSTLCGEALLQRMREGETATSALGAVSAADDGRDHRQLAALDQRGRTAAFTGALTPGACGHRQGADALVVGCDLRGEHVMEAVLEVFATAPGALVDRLVASLRVGLAGEAGDLASAALLVLHREAPPLSLRVDGQADPLDGLAGLVAAAHAPAHAGWIRHWPTLVDPFRAPSAAEMAALPRQGADGDSSRGDGGT